MTRSQANRRSGNRACFYHRDSLGRADQAPSQYVAWACEQAKRLGLRLVGTPADIRRMISDDLPVLGDLFLDYDVSGHLLSRPALDALRKRVDADRSIVRIFIPLRERLARPQDPLDGDQLEMEFRRKGITLHYQDRIVEPVSRGQRRSISDAITSVVEFEAAGKYRRDLASKIIPAQISLAKQGLSTGGRPPFFLRRWLVNPQGEPVRELAKGEVVRMAGCHVVWLPTDDESLALALRILDMLERMPASRVAAELTKEGIPSPDNGRQRRDRGSTHLVSGTWNTSTINSVARCAALLGMTSYGRRSMGDQLRFTPAGPRELSDDDYRNDDKPKVVQNEECLTASAHHPPLVDVTRHRRLLETLDKRAGTQKGKPRSRDPDNNPLGGRVIDMDCCWPMYRVPHRTKGFRYRCGLYMQSHGAECNHNQLDGPSAVAFGLSTIRERFLSSRVQTLIRSKLARLADQQEQTNRVEAEFERVQNSLNSLRVKIETVTRNLARASSEEIYRKLEAELSAILEKETSLKTLLEALRHSSKRPSIQVEELDRALVWLDRLSAMIESANSMAEARAVLEATNLRLFCRFQRVEVANPRKDGQNFTNKLISGTITLGAAPSRSNLRGTYFAEKNEEFKRQYWLSRPLEWANWRFCQREGKGVRKCQSGRQDGY